METALAPRLPPFPRPTGSLQHMGYLQYVARRAAFAVASVYAAVTAAFLLAEYLWHYRLGKALGWASLGGLTPEEAARVRREFIRERNLGEPIHVRYVDWLGDVTTLDWGYSYAYGAPVDEVLLGPAMTTMEYVIPGVVLAMALSAVLGVATAVRKDSHFDRSVRFVVYALVAFPAFVAVDYAIYLLTSVRGSAFAQSLVTARPKRFAALLVAMSLLAGQVRFGRAASIEQINEDFVKLLDAKGAGRLMVARHVLRNAALTIVSMSSEIIPVLTLNIFVIEEVLPIDGMASVILQGIDEGDVALLIWSTMLFVGFAIVGNFLIDVLYGYLDPRIRTD